MDNNNENGQTPEEIKNLEGTPKGMETTETDPATPQENSNTPQEPKKEPEIDYKEKFSASTRENQRINAEKQRTDDKIATLTNEEMPTEDEMAQATPNWELLTDFEKQTAIKVEHTARIARKVRLTQLEAEESSRWKSDLERTVQDNPELKGLEEEFKEFCYQPKNKNSSLDTLAGSFLYNKSKTSKPQEPVEPKNDFTAMDPATNPIGAAPRITPMSDDEAEKIRKTDPVRYNELIRKGILK